MVAGRQVRAWQARGFCAVANLLSLEEVRAFQGATRGGVLLGVPNARNFGGIGFPFLALGMEALNRLALHPRLIHTAEQLLGTAPLLLSQAECWVKRGEEEEPHLQRNFFANTDQRMHMDFPNHYLTAPPPWDQPEAVAMIVYLDDGAECGGCTHIVPRLGPNDPAYEYPYVHMPGVGNVPWINDRALAEQYLDAHQPVAAKFRQQHLYAREEPVPYTVGTVLLYRLDVWHRGTPLRPRRDRAVVNLLFKTRQAALHITNWHKGWATNAYNTWSVSTLGARIAPPQEGQFENLLSALTPQQRTVLGFPPPGDPFWTESTLAALAKRYPNMDVRPYQTSAATIVPQKPAKL